MEYMGHVAIVVPGLPPDATFTKYVPLDGVDSKSDGTLEAAWVRTSGGAMMFGDYLKLSLSDMLTADMADMIPILSRESCDC